MKVAHSFEVPYPDKLVEAQGLLNELGRLVGVEYACLGCGRQFTGSKNNRHKISASQLRKEALKALRMHMIDKQHNFLYLGIEDPVVMALSIAEAQKEGGRMSLPPNARIGGELYSQFYVPARANKTLVLVSKLTGVLIIES